MEVITYTDKTTINVNPGVPANMKCQASDMNEIKQVVNNNSNGVGNLSDLSTPNKTSIVNAINSIENNFYDVKATKKTTNLGTNSWVDMATAKSVDLKSGTYILICNFTIQGAASGSGIASARITINGVEQKIARETVNISGTLASSGSITTSLVLENDTTVSLNSQVYATVTTKTVYDIEFMLLRLI